MTPRSILLRAAMGVLYPAMVLASLWILFRGHDEPGGGFIGGMVAVAATAALAVAQGSHRALGRIPLGPMRLAAAGALLSLLSGLPALFVGDPYMSHYFFDFAVGPVVLPLSTVLVFDVGVYAVVWSALGGLAAHVIGIDEARVAELTEGESEGGER